MGSESNLDGDNEEKALSGIYRYFSIGGVGIGSIFESKISEKF